MISYLSLRKLFNYSLSLCTIACSNKLIELVWWELNLKCIDLLLVELSSGMLNKFFNLFLVLKSFWSNVSFVVLIDIDYYNLFLLMLGRLNWWFIINKMSI